MKALGGETVPGVTLEAKMNSGWGSWAGIVEEVAPGPSFPFIQKHFNKGQLCARHCSGSWDTVVKCFFPHVAYILVGERNDDMYHGKEYSRVE